MNNQYRQDNDVSLLAIVPVLNRPTLRLGDQGNYVNLLQDMLKELMFYNGVINGIFDNSTLTSVKSFQSNNKLTADGVVGKDTWSALIYLYTQLAICEASFHIVQPGDTLYSIAKKYNTIVEELIRVNNLTSTTLTIGQKLVIPGTEATIPSENTITYTVQSGDTLWSIANRYKTTVSDIKDYNNLTSNTLTIGQKLKIPVTSTTPPAYVSYTVQKGDTLWSIASEYNMTVDALKLLNNLTSNIISIGQVLKVPNV
ncbi:MAG: LysM peptidoglycan-binding domain-containing protein [Ignavibacteriales bacterium]